MQKPIATFKLVAKAHLAEAFRWSGDTGTEVVEALAVGLGMAGPVLIAALSGHIALGLLASAGSLAVGRVEIGPDFSSQLRRLAGALAPAIVATLLAILFRGTGWLSVVALVLLSAIAATISGFSRFLAVVATRFVVFLTIVTALTVPPASPDAWRPGGFFLLIVAGALWTSLLSLVFDAWLSLHRAVDSRAPNESVRPTSLRQKFVRWKRSLTSLAGWSYPIRLAACLGLAAAMEILWPDHHLHWVSLTVAILTERHIEPVPVKTTQRALGTAFGVGVARLFLQLGLPSWALILLIGLLAGTRCLLRNRNYLAYSAVMTPLIVLIIDAGRTLQSGILVDRLVATLIGALLVVGANLLFSRLTPSRQSLSTPETYLGFEAQAADDQAASARYRGP